MVNKIFISFSGTPSDKLAQHLEDFLNRVVASAQTFRSASGIISGEDWNNRLNTELEATHYGLLCLTPNNYQSTWVHYEAGALCKHWQEAKACAILWGGLTATSLRGPLEQRQHRTFNEHEIRHLVRDINEATEPRLASKVLDDLFDRFWPEFETRCNETLSSSPITPPAPPSDSEMLSRIYEKLQQIQTSHAVESRHEFSTTASALHPHIDFHSDAKKFLARHGAVVGKTLQLIPGTMLEDTTRILRELESYEPYGNPDMLLANGIIVIDKDKNRVYMNDHLFHEYLRSQ